MLYNLDELWDLTDGDTALVTSLVSQFIIDSSTSITNINNAIKLRDFSSIKFNAHRLKPALNALKIDQTKDIIAQIERKAANNLFDDELVNSVKELDAIVKMAIVALKGEFAV